MPIAPHDPTLIEQVVAWLEAHPGSTVNDMLNRTVPQDRFDAIEAFANDGTLADRLAHGPTGTVAGKLVEAYHLIFDVKDSDCPRGSDAALHAFEALNWLELLMGALGITRPRRYDGQGRPT